MMRAPPFNSSTDTTGKAVCWKSARIALPAREPAAADMVAADSAAVVQASADSAAAAASAAVEEVSQAVVVDLATVAVAAVMVVAATTPMPALVRAPLHRCPRTHSLTTRLPVRSARRLFTSAM